MCVYVCVCTIIYCIAVKKNKKNKLLHPNVRAAMTPDPSCHVWETNRRKCGGNAGGKGAEKVLNPNQYPNNSQRSDLRSSVIWFLHSHVLHKKNVPVGSYHLRSVSNPIRPRRIVPCRGFAFTHGHHAWIHSVTFN